MISRDYRFHGYNSLQRVYKNGQQVREPYIGLRYLANPRRQAFRAAVVVSRKIDKSAVVRNRLRRRVYEVIRMNQPQITQPYDLVFTVFSPQLGELSQPQLLKSISSLLIKARVIKSPASHAIVETEEN